MAGAACASTHAARCATSKPAPIPPSVKEAPLRFHVSTTMNTSSAPMP
eukprot:CAMPEP_0185563348 /NCGR_PEP_ID=MMETSP1381-20130426/63263_1 /TAXON_ID=298111 /ORGANISM="Pavlova sp., Strain CCMP459" /LENGTH=47 /DNA_ID= /DNA_START= /DNA_END= /DNA_ORIENTATION=